MLIPSGTPGLGEDSSSSRRGRVVKDRVTFVSGNPMVDVTHGILHLYKEKYVTSEYYKAFRSILETIVMVRENWQNFVKINVSLE